MTAMRLTKFVMGGCSAMVFLLCAEARAGVPPAAPVSIEKLAGPVRSRILTGTSSEGTLVEATTRNSQYDRIVSEELNENGYTISDFRFDHGSPTSAHIVRAGYKGYPNTHQAGLPPHHHLVVDPTDVVLCDQAYDLTPKAPPCPNTECADARKEARTQAELYVRFMNTPPKLGTSEDDHYWDCVSVGDENCSSFKQEAAQ